MEVSEIKNIDKLIQLNNGQKVLNYKISRLTAPGDNYGSLMLSVDIEAEDSYGKIEKKNVVAKLVPPNEFIQEIFNTQVTFRNEIAFYKHIVPALQNFQRENGIKEVINFSAECFGSRINLEDDSSKPVDANAALVLENLKISNFETIDRLKGLNLDAAKLVLKNLAHFHAVPLALKMKKPEIFDKEVRPYLDPWQLKKKFLEETKDKDLTRLIDQVDELKPLKDRIFTAFDKIMEPYEVRELFGTITHNDCWTNNNMFKLEGTKVVDSKLVDYQICSYGSPAKDVVFLLYSSVQQEVMEKYYDDLIKFYYQTFLDCLKEVDCDISPFTFELFQKEIDFEARYSQFGHLSFMIFGIYAPREGIKELSDMTPEDERVKITDLIKEKFLFIIKDFAKRKWI